MVFRYSLKDFIAYFIPVEEYIKSLIAHPELVDRLALSSDDQVDIFSLVIVYYCY